MSRWSRAVVLAVSLMVFVGAGRARADDFFADDPIHRSAMSGNPRLFTTFMQFSKNSVNDWYLHSGIDVKVGAGVSGDSLFSANAGQAHVALVDNYNGQVMVVRSDHSCGGVMEALLFAHLEVEDDSIRAELGDRLDLSSFLGFVDDAVGHVHIDYYRDFEYTMVWDAGHCLSQNPSHYKHIDPAGQNSWKAAYRNPINYAFPDVEWALDDCGEGCYPFGVVDTILYDTTHGRYVVVVTAYDWNNNSSYWVCKSGIYSMDLYAEGDENPKHEILFDAFVRPGGQEGLPTWEDYYLNDPGQPHMPCNSAEPYGELKYYLTWTVPYVDVDHDFVVKVSDGRNPPKVLKWSRSTVDYRIFVTCHRIESGILIRWLSPASFSVGSFHLYRSYTEDRLGVLLDGTFSVSEPGSGAPGCLLYQYVDAPPRDVVSEDVYYTLVASLGSGRREVMDVASIENPNRADNAVRIYPNPFTERVTLRFVNPHKGHVTVDIYSVQGRVVKQIVSESLPGGWVSIQWDGRDRCGRPVVPGAYFAAVTRDNETVVEKIMLVR